MGGVSEEMRGWQIKTRCTNNNRGGSGLLGGGGDGRVDAPRSYISTGQSPAQPYNTDSCAAKTNTNAGITATKAST